MEAILSNIVQLKRRPRPLRKTYSLTEPYEVEREDLDDGTIRYTVWDYRPESYRFVCGLDDDCGHDPYAMFNAKQIVRGLNLLVQYGMETLPKVREVE